MSETKTPRPVAEIQQEYQKVCVQAGHLQYQIHALSKDLGLVNDTLRELNFEAAASQKLAADAAKSTEEEQGNK